MGLFGMMSYDEAMETLIEGTASKAVLEKAYKRIKKNAYNESQGTVQLHYCFGQLYGIEKLECSAEKRIFGSVWLSVDYKGDFDDDNLQLVKRFLTSKHDFTRLVNETALNMQPDDKNFKYATIYLIFAYLYGCGFEPDIEKAEEYAKRAESLGDEKAAVWKTRIEAVKNSK